MRRGSKAPLDIAHRKRSRTGDDRDHAGDCAEDTGAGSGVEPRLVIGAPPERRCECNRSADEHNVRKGKQRSKRDRQSVAVRQGRRYLDVDGMGGCVLNRRAKSAARLAQVFVHASILPSRRAVVRRGFDLFLYAKPLQPIGGRLRSESRSIELPAGFTRRTSARTRPESMAIVSSPVPANAAYTSARIDFAQTVNVAVHAHSSVPDLDQVVSDLNGIGSSS